ncbi:MAG: DUF1800 domain-containing protein [Verrucomicrobiales bacterium]
MLASKFPALIFTLAVLLTGSVKVNAQLDLNRDGFLDLWQIEHDAFDLQFDIDDDGDESINGFESLSGTNPDDDSSFLEPTKLTAGSTAGMWTLNWDTVPGIGYQVQVSASPVGPWESVGTPITGDGNSTAHVFDGSGITALQGASGFARIRVVQIDADDDGVSAYEELLLGLSDSSGTSNTDPGAISDLEFARRHILQTGEFGQGGLNLTSAQINSARFLTQATFGASWELINEVTDLGIETWIDQQMDSEPEFHRPLVEQYTAPLNEESEDWGVTRSRAWWHRTMTADDVLRQRVAFALSEIFVISDRSDDIFDSPVGTAAYYDLLVEHAFGNYEELLADITFSPIMGFYLSHLGNRKTDESQNIFPDENYAREIMQLFSIGLYELNADGSRKQAGGEDIPTYTNVDITEMAKIFTGLNYGNQDDWVYEDFEEEPEIFFDLDWVLDAPMDMYDFWHEPGPKTIFGTEVIDEDDPSDNIYAAIGILADHDNVGPYIGHKLIQRLIKSNPSPAYIARISAVWDDDGEGTRGNLGAVVKAILMDPEARNRSVALADSESGKLREPIIRYMNILRAFNATPSRYGWHLDGEYVGENLQQFPLRSPSVFNFYSPTFQPNGPLADNDLVGPEFQIMNSQTAISIHNLIYEAVMFDDLYNDRDRRIVFDYSEEIALADDPVTLMDRLSLLLGQGEISDETYQTIVSEITHLIQDEEDPKIIVRFAITALTTSPDFNILR